VSFFSFFRSKTAEKPDENSYWNPEVGDRLPKPKIGTKNREKFLPQCPADKGRRANLGPGPILTPIGVKSLGPPDNPGHRPDTARTAKDGARTGRTARTLKLTLSHESAFLQLIADGFDKANLRLLFLSREGISDTVIKAWDMTTELAPGYHKDVATLSAYYHGEAEDLRAVVRCIRPVMEGYLRSTYHSSFAEKEWLGDMLGRIRDAGAGTPLDGAKPMLADIESLNDFTKRYHHDDNSPKQGAEPIQDAELQSFVKLTLKLTNRL